MRSRCFKAEYAFYFSFTFIGKADRRLAEKGN